MAKVKILRPATLIVGAFIGWALCGAVMMIGRTFLSIQTTLIIHAIAAPVFFFVISLIYFKKFNYTTPLLTALIFVTFVVCAIFMPYISSLGLYKNLIISLEVFYYILDLNFLQIHH